MDSATVGVCFYQSLSFSASDPVEKLEPKFNMSLYTALLIQILINLEQFKYGSGRKFSQERLKKTKVKLLATEGRAPLAIHGRLP